MLINNQAKIVDEMFYSLKDKNLFNIPTGTGKTYIFISLAMRVMKELGKKVIISTSSNQLVREFYEIAAQHFLISKEDMKIQIGKSNYLDHEQYLFLMNSGELDEFLEPESIKAFNELIKTVDKKQIFLSDFNEVVKYKDIAAKKHVNELLMKKTADKEVFGSSLNFTNHFFLIASVKSSKRDVLNDCVVLMDEVHTIGEVAQTILSRDFSLFSTKISLSRMNQEISNMDDFIGKEAIRKNILTLVAKTTKLLNSTTSPSKLDHFANESNTRDYIGKIKSLSVSTVVKTLTKQLEKRKDMFSGELDIFIREMKNISLIVESSKKDIRYANLSFTPSRGYPLLSSFSENPLGFLNRILWQRLDFFVGVSASVCSSFDPNKKEIDYALARIGLIGESKDIIFHDKFFNRELIDVYTPQENTPASISVYDDDFNENNSVYHQYMVDYIHKHHKGKNSIVFCSGYKETEYMSSLYKKLFDDAIIYYSNKKQASSHTLREFKETGGILFATREYGTGITLKGELLENIFLLRYPYPIVNNYKWETLRKRNINIYMNHIKYEMLITLMQWLGRLQRTSTDSGSIYLLDKKYLFNKPLRYKVDEVLNYYGVIREHKQEQKIYKTSQTIDESERDNALSALDGMLDLSDL